MKFPMNMLYRVDSEYTKFFVESVLEEEWGISENSLESNSISLNFQENEYFLIKSINIHQAM